MMGYVNVRFDHFLSGILVIIFFNIFVFIILPVFVRGQGKLRITACQETDSYYGY
jgi:hypothetical protein